MYLGWTSEEKDGWKDGCSICKRQLRTSLTLFFISHVFTQLWAAVRTWQENGERARKTHLSSEMGLITWKCAAGEDFTETWGETARPMWFDILTTGLNTQTDSSGFLCKLSLLLHFTVLQMKSQSDFKECERLDLFPSLARLRLLSVCFMLILWEFWSAYYVKILQSGFSLQLL